MANLASPLPDEMTITLRKPLKWGDRTVTELKLREPTAAEVEKVQNLDGMTSNLELIGLITGVPRTILGNVGVRDINRAVDYLRSFTAGDLLTGPTS